MITYKHEITLLDIDNTSADMPNVVKGIHVAYNAVDDLDNISKVVGIYIPLTPNGTIIPLENLTKDIVESWIENHPYFENAKSLLATQIDDTRADRGVKMIAPPWNIPTTPDTSATPSVNTTRPTRPFIMTEESVTALVYRVLDEIEASKV